LLLSGTILSLAMLSSAHAETVKLAQAPQPPGQAETKPESKPAPPAPAQQQPRPPQPPAAAPPQPPHPAPPPAAAQPHPQPPAPPAARPAAPSPTPAPRAEPKAEPPKATPPAPAAQTPARPAEQRQEQRQERRDERRDERRENRQEQRSAPTRTIIRHNESDRFRTLSPNARVERRGNATVTEISRPGGVRVFTETDADGRLLRRYRRDQSGREIIIIDNRRPMSVTNYYVDLPPPRIRIPRERYIVEADRVDERVIYETLIAPPVERLDRRYTIDQVRYSPEIRARMPRVDLDTVTFDTGSWEVAPNQARSLAPIAEAINRAVQRNPREVFLIEGHTDAVGNDVDNLSLSDRRAESVAVLLTEQFNVPPENLVTQGYGEQYLKVQSDGPERQNRRVTVRRITPLLAQGDAPPPPRRR